MTALAKQRRPGSGFLAAARRRPGLIVGAAIGNGMAANFAIRGGADFLIAISAGRIRSMGEPSLGALLPTHDCNRLVLDFGPREILPRSTVPVLVGASTFDPRRGLAEIVEEMHAAGFDGVVNFPTASMIEGPLRQVLEAEGLGFSRELELLSLARARGMATLAYTHTEEEAAQAAAIGVNAVNVGLGWNQGGARGGEPASDLGTAGLYVDKVARRVRSVDAQILCMVEGGPIVSPQDLNELCRIANVDGYVGGSTIDRVPLETAIEVVTAGFKTIDRLQLRGEGDGPSRFRDHLPLALIGRSAEIRRARASFARLAARDVPVLLTVPCHERAAELAAKFHALGKRRGKPAVSVHMAGKARQDQQLELLGAAPGGLPGVTRTRLGRIEAAHGTTLILHEIEEMPADLLREVAGQIAAGALRRVGGEETVPVTTRMVLVLDREAPGAAETTAMLTGFGFACFNMPALSERPEDLPPLLEAILASVRERLGRRGLALDPAAFRLLLEHDWPGDVPELWHVVEQAAMNVPSDQITAVALRAVMRGQGGNPRSTFEGEREWILDGLRRNRFHRGDTAAFLGISRKTLYNRMKKLRLDERPEPPAGPRHGR